jgi:hypothetical protein
MDKGHAKLVLDVSILLKQVESFEFHDFKNDKFPEPKMALAEILQYMKDNCINGKYDN